MMVQGLTGQQAYEVESLCSRYVLARKRHDDVEARNVAARLLGIYRQAGVDIPALESYRQFLRETDP